MKTRKWLLISGLTLAFFAYSLLVSTVAATMALAAAEDPLVARLAGVQNVQRPCPWLLTGGQPDAQALAVLAEDGSWDVLDIRGVGETRGLDEKAVTKSLGLHYRAIPTRATDFDDSRFTAFRHHLIASGPKHPMFVHCASGNRVGAALLPWLVLDQGLEEDVAFETARKMGLSDPELTARALDYIRARQPRAPIAR